MNKVVKLEVAFKKWLCVIIIANFVLFPSEIWRPCRSNTCILTLRLPSQHATIDFTNFFTVSFLKDRVRLQGLHESFIPRLFLMAHSLKFIVDLHGSCLCLCTSSDIIYLLVCSHFDALLPIILVGDRNSGKSDIYEQYTKGT